MPLPDKSRGRFMPLSEGISRRRSAGIQNHMVFFKILKNFYPQIIESTSKISVWKEVLKECQRNGIHKNQTAQYLGRTRWPAFIRLTTKKWQSKKQLDERDKQVIEIERIRTPNYCLPMDKEEEREMAKKETEEKKSMEEGELEAANNDETMKEEDDDPQMEDHDSFDDTHEPVKAPAATSDELVVDASPADDTHEPRKAPAATSDELVADSSPADDTHEPLKAHTATSDGLIVDASPADDTHEPRKAHTATSDKLVVDASPADDKLMDPLMSSRENIEDRLNTAPNTSNNIVSSGSNDTTNHLQQEFYRSSIRLCDALYEILKDEMMRRNLTTSGNSNI